MLRWKVGPAIGLDIATQRDRIRLSTHVLRRHVLAATEAARQRNAKLPEVSMRRMIRLLREGTNDSSTARFRSDRNAYGHAAVTN